MPLPKITLLGYSYSLSKSNDTPFVKFHLLNLIENCFSVLLLQILSNLLQNWIR